MTNLEHGRLTGAYVDPAAGRVTVGEWSRQWMQAQVQLKPKTRALYESLLRCWVVPRWGNVQLARVTYGAVAEWVGRMHREGLSPSRSRQAYHVLTALLDDAVKDGPLVRDQALGVDLPRVVAKPRRYLRHEDLHALASSCGPYRLLVLLSLAIASGASVKAVQRMLGHASATLTLDRYGHLFPDELNQIATRLDDAMRASDVVPMCSQHPPAPSGTDDPTAETPL